MYIVVLLVVMVVVVVVVLAVLVVNFSVFVIVLFCVGHCFFIVLCSIISMCVMTSLQSICRILPLSWINNSVTAQTCTRETSIIRVERTQCLTEILSHSTEEDGTVRAEQTPRLTGPYHQSESESPPRG